MGLCSASSTLGLFAIPNEPDNEEVTARESHSFHRVEVDCPTADYCDCALENVARSSYVAHRGGDC
jgi:hypothetical protein